MSREKKGGCIKRFVLGCGTLVALFVGLGVLSIVIGYLDRSQPTQDATFEGTDLPSIIREPADMLGEGQGPQGKPVEMKLEVAMAEFNLKPHDVPGEFKIDGNYDEANFELITEVEEKKDRTIYHLRFRNKRTMMGMLMGEISEDSGFDANDVQNKITLYVPKDLLYRMNWDVKMGDYNMDVSGLAIENFETKMSMGDFDLDAKEANPVPLKKFRLDAKMGESRIDGMQNLRSRQSFMKQRMGALTVTHDGAYQEDSEMQVNVRMGEVRIDRPPNTNLDQNLSAFMGGAREMGGDAFKEDQATLKLRGNAFMGEIRTRNAYDRTFERGMAKMFMDTPYEEIEAFYKAHIEAHPKDALSETRLNQLGYRLLGNAEFEAAINCFKLNVAVHPNYANGWDSLGEGYYRAGEHQQSIEAFEKALEFDPENSRIEGFIRKNREAIERRAKEAAEDAGEE